MLKGLSSFLCNIVFTFGKLDSFELPDSFPFISQASKMYWLVNFKVLSAIFFKQYETVNLTSHSVSSLYDNYRMR